VLASVRFCVPTNAASRARIGHEPGRGVPNPKDLAAPITLSAPVRSAKGTCNVIGSEEWRYNLKGGVGYGSGHRHSLTNRGLRRMAQAARAHFSADASPRNVLEPPTFCSVDAIKERFTARIFRFATHNAVPSAARNGETVLASIHAIKSRRRYRTARPAWTYAGPNDLARHACKVLTESLSKSAACTSVRSVSKSLLPVATLMDIVPHRLRYGATVARRGSGE